MRAGNETTRAFFETAPLSLRLPRGEHLPQGRNRYATLSKLTDEVAFRTRLDDVKARTAVVIALSYVPVAGERHGEATYDRIKVFEWIADRTQITALMNPLGQYARHVLHTTENQLKSRRCAA